MSDMDDADEAIATLGAEIAQNEADLKDATLVRDKERADFEAAEKELVDSIDMLDRAIGILEREMGKGSALLQKPLDNSSIKAMLASISAVIDAASFSVADKQKILALVQSKQSEQDEDALDSL